MGWASRKDRADRTADRWAARTAGGLSDREEAERDAWRAADPMHEQAWQDAARVMAVTRGIRSAHRDSQSALRHAPRHGFRPTFAIASVAALIVAAGGAYLLDRQIHPVVGPSATEYAANGMARTLHLDDGTVVTLGKASRVQVDFAGPVRAVRLETGIARFDVAHDAARPFVVSAADRKVIAIGTRFDVALRPSGLVVTLYQGAVEVAPKTPDAGKTPVHMHHGQRLIVDGEHEQLQSDPAIDRTAENGVHTVDPTSVADIVAAANHMAAVPIHLADPALGARQIEGRFKVSDSDALAQQLGAALDLVVTRNSKGWLLSKP